MGLGPQKMFNIHLLIDRQENYPVSLRQESYMLLYAPLSSSAHIFTHILWCYMTNFNGPRWLVYGYWCPNDSSWVTWWASFCSEPREKPTWYEFAWAPFLFLDGAIWGISILFKVWPPPPKGLSFLLTRVASSEQLSKVRVQPDMSSSVLDSLSLLCLLEAFSSQLYFCFAVLFIFLNYEFFEGKIFSKFTKP